MGVNSTITPQQNMQTLAATQMIRDKNKPKKKSWIRRLIDFFRKK